MALCAVYSPKCVPVCRCFILRVFEKTDIARTRAPEINKKMKKRYAFVRRRVKFSTLEKIIVQAVELSLEK